MSAKRHDIQDHEVQGLKLFKGLSNLLERLHSVGCERDRAGNRRLHMDQYLTLLLLYRFNPICTSLRSLQQVSTLRKAQKTLGVPRASLGSLSEARQVFDSQALVGIIEELADQLKPLAHDARVNDLGAILTVVDGTVLKALPKMTWAMWLDEDHKGLKAHVQFEVLKGVPVAAAITDANGNEKAVLAERLTAGRLYVLDRGYAKYGLLQDILEAGSSFVCRVYDNAAFEVVEERTVSREAEAAGVVRDAVVILGRPSNRDGLTRPVRLINLRCQPHPKRNRQNGPAQGQTITLVTDRLDLPADVVAVIYRHRWSIELFFRFFKHVLGCRRLLSGKQNGIELQTYAAIIACLLIALWTNRKPTLRTTEMIGYYLMGWAEEDELQAHIAGLKEQNEY